MAYGMNSLILEQIEWGLINGFDVIDAVKTKYHPSYKKCTPETVWNHYGIKKEIAENAGIETKNVQFLYITGDKSSIEMAAVVNASHANFPVGLKYPRIGVNDISNILIYV